MDDRVDVIEQLVHAVNDHDLDRLTECFADDYVNETPAHPSRGFRGRAQVRRNWQQIFSFVPDVQATLVRTVAHDGTVWTEWEMTGTRRDGTPHQMAGTVIFGVNEGVATWARFYLEPVDDGGGTVDDAIQRQVGR